MDSEGGARRVGLDAPQRPRRTRPVEDAPGGLGAEAEEAARLEAGVRHGGRGQEADGGRGLGAGAVHVEAEQEEVGGIALVGLRNLSNWTEGSKSR